MTNTKARKGDVVALQIEHTCHDAKMKRHSYTEWQLAVVASAKRDGTVVKVIFPPATHHVAVALIGRVWTIDKVYQERARRLVEAFVYPVPTWPSADALKAAIRSLPASADPGDARVPGIADPGDAR